MSALIVTARDRIAPSAPTAYQSHWEHWEDRSTIRTRPRRKLEEDGLHPYPLERQPLASHPHVTALGDVAVNWVLLQSLYKYINDIIIFETEIVNKTAREIGKGLFPFDFPFACRRDAMSVLIDEDYHAYVAMDYMQQVIELTGVAPIKLPTCIELSLAIPIAVAGLAPEFRAGMELLAVGISENTVTADVAAFSRDPSIKRSIKGLMSDHLADEGRHSVFWQRLSSLYWAAIDEESRLAIGGALSAFLDRYLTNELQYEFDRRIVDGLGLSNESRSEVLESLVASYPITGSHPMIGNIRAFLQRSGLLNHEPTHVALQRFLG